jgi:WbqC-like protein family
MRLAVLQSNYIPWKGYFDLMAAADQFIVYDSVQYTKNDWRNRNILVSKSGPVWLTIPINTAGRADQSINEATIGDPRWARKHWQTASQLLARRSGFHLFEHEWAKWFTEVSEMTLLHDVNVYLLRRIADQLHISTPITDDTEYELIPDSPTGKLVQLCEQLGASRYLTGPAGLNYLQLDQFRAKGIGVDVIDYDHYPAYPQVSKEFRHGVSVLDLLANTGSAAPDHLLRRTTTVV